MEDARLRDAQNYADQVIGLVRAGSPLDKVALNKWQGLYTVATDGQCEEMVAYVQEKIGALLTSQQLIANAFFFEGGAPEADEEETEKTYGNWADLEDLMGSIEWEWQPWLCKGLLTLVAGKPGEGKSALMLRVAATFLLGWNWPDDTPFDGQAGKVLWCESEAAQAINLERAKAWGLPLDQLLTVWPDPRDDVQLDKIDHREAVEKMAHRDDVKLIIVDSLKGAHGGDENSSAMMETCKWLAELARDTGKPVLLSHHLRKRGILDLAGKITLDRIRGSSAIVQTTRVVWAVDAPDTGYEESKRLSVIKSNLARFPEPVGFTIGDEARLVFGDAPEAPRKETQTDKAVDLLRALLTSGPVTANDVRDETDEAGISWATVSRAKKILGIVPVRDADNKRCWSLPARDEPPFS